MFLFHILHDLLQRFLLLNVHAITYFFLVLPVVHHGGEGEGTRPTRLELYSNSCTCSRCRKLTRWSVEVTGTRVALSWMRAPVLTQCLWEEVNKSLCHILVIPDYNASGIRITGSKRVEYLSSTPLAATVALVILDTSTNH